MSRIRLSIVLVPLALVAVAFGMRAAVASQRAAAMRAAERSDAAARLLTAELDMETGVRGFLLAGRDEFLAPYRNGLRASDRAERDVRREAGGDGPTLRILAEHDRLERQWSQQADAAVAQRRLDVRYHLDLRRALARKALMDQLRAVNGRLQARLEERRNDDLRAAGLRATVLILLLTSLLGGVGWLLLHGEATRRRRADRLELDYRASQREFSDVIQVVRSEPEAHSLLKRHLEVSIPGATVDVLQRNVSDNRLQPATLIEPDSPLAKRLAAAEPTACVAIRLGRGHRDGGESGSLLSCRVCGKLPGRSACEPLLMGGQLIGSVLVQADRELCADGERRLTESVSQAAPVLANLRNLALAERRASTDSLTGLPNRRAIQDTLRRLSAHAARSVEPLTVLSIDLDRFKSINDEFGHDMGDTVLAQVAATLAAAVRGSDFVGRLGGEEFVVLAPNTGLDGALVLAESLRSALERERVAGLDRPVTASFGLAVLPDHAVAADALLRASDRALYVAKDAGRNRVEVAAAPSAEAAV
jgi:diguanylate cyclase (GGDEF)-like protein